MSKKKVKSPKLNPSSRVETYVYRGLLIALAVIPICVTEMLDKGEDKWFLIRTLGPIMAVVLHAAGKPLKSRWLDPLAVCAVAWIGVQAFSLVDAHNMGLALTVITRQVGLLGFFFVVRYYAAQPDTNRYLPILYILALIAILTSIYGTFQHFGYDYIDWEVNAEVPISRGVSFMGHATFAASVLIMMLPITLVLALSAASRVIRISLFAGTALMLYHLSFSGARVATVALFLSAGMGLCVWVYSRWASTDTEYTAKQSTAFRKKAIAAFLVCFLLGGGLAYRAWQLKGSDLFGLTEGGMAQRVYAWETANRMFLANPINGVGVGHYEIMSPHYWNVVESSRYVQFGRMLYQPHNDYLEAAAEMGLPGVACLLGLVVFALTQCAALIPRHRMLAIGLWTAVLASALDSFFIFAWQVPDSALIFWVLLGIISGLYARPEEVPSDG